jgi:hypothetical protein
VSEEGRTDLPGVPNAIWTVKNRQEDETHRCGLCSFVVDVLSHYVWHQDCCCAGDSGQGKVIYMGQWPR